MRPRAHASPLLHEQATAEKIGLHVEPIEAVYVARRINVEKMHGVHLFTQEVMCMAASQ